MAAQLCDPGSYRDLAVRRQRIKRDQEAGEEELEQEADISEALPFFKRCGDSGVVIHMLNVSKYPHVKCIKNPQSVLLHLSSIAGKNTVSCEY